MSRICLASHSATLNQAGQSHKSSTKWTKPDRTKVSMDIKGYGNKINKTHTHSLFSHKQIGKKKLNQNQRQVETNKGKKVNKAFDFRFIKTLSHFTISGDLSAINFKIYFFFRSVLLQWKTKNENKETLLYFKLIFNKSIIIK